MFIKRSYYTFRFVLSLIIQIGFPVFFTGLGHLIIIYSPSGTDPPRILSLSNSGLDARNITVFYAELDGQQFNFSVRCRK